MFTGLIERVCKVKSVSRVGGAMFLTIDLGNLADECKIGDSIAVNGVCLTITKFEGGGAVFDVSAETLSKSTVDKLNPSSEVNIERAVKATDRFGGHFVQGHVDGTATVRAIDMQGKFAEIKFSAEAELLDGMVVKGSVAVDGISLTISGMDKDSFSVALIPETLNKTILRKIKIGDMVNIETDIIVKTIKNQLEKILPQTEPLTAEKLRGLGF
ncbi:MAG: riboflavin synthase [Sedimentisphaerales bacterium]|nr:riboflavin synthase [Sedimentisphaerales bacterium]